MGKTKPFQCFGCEYIDECEGCSPNRLEQVREIDYTMCYYCLLIKADHEGLRKAWEDSCREKAEPDPERWRKIKKSVVGQLGNTEIGKKLIEETIKRAYEKGESLDSNEAEKKVEENISKQLNKSCEDNFGFGKENPYFNLFQYENNEIVPFLVTFYKMVHQHEVSFEKKGSSKAITNREYRNELKKEKYGKNYGSIANYIMLSNGIDFCCSVDIKKVNKIISEVKKGNVLLGLKEYLAVCEKDFRNALSDFEGDANTYYISDVAQKASDIFRKLLLNIYWNPQTSFYHSKICEVLERYELVGPDSLKIISRNSNIVMDYCTGIKMWSLAKESEMLINCIDHLKKNTEEEYKWDIRPEYTQLCDAKADISVIKNWILEDEGKIRKDRFMEKYNVAKSVAKILIGNSCVVSADELLVTKAVYREIYVYKTQIEGYKTLSTIAKRMKEGTISLNDKIYELEVLIRAVNRSLFRMKGRRESYFQMLDCERHYLLYVLASCKNVGFDQDYSVKWLVLHKDLAESIYHEIEISERCQ